MKSARVGLLVAVLLTVPAMTSCWPFRKARKSAPPPPPQPVQTQPPASAKPISSKPPELPAGEVPVSPPPTELPTTAQPAPPPPLPKKRPSPAGPPVQPSAQPPPTPAPQLRQILTPQQQQELNTLINQRIDRARRILASLKGHSLTRDQASTVNQIRTFIEQAQEARKDDLVRAGNLAERADVLAQDLRSRLR